MLFFFIFIRYIIGISENNTTLFLSAYFIIYSIIYNESRLRFVERWEHEISKNPVFIEEFKEEERYLTENLVVDGPGKPCGRIFMHYGLYGPYMELRDASVHTSNGIDDLGQTDFGNNNLYSMVPFEGKPALRYERSDGHSDCVTELFIF